VLPVALDTTALLGCRFDDQDDTVLYTAASDGLVSCTDMDTGAATKLVDLNPNGWQVWWPFSRSRSSVYFILQKVRKRMPIEKRGQYLDTGSATKLVDLNPSG
jgi:hypothetical protein